MAGRAGRRGLDKVGTVIMCCFGDEPPPQLVLRNLLTGSSTKLQSQFRLTYSMILNLLRVEDMTVEGMIKRSFSEFATQRALTANEYPKLLSRGLKTLAKLDKNFRHDIDRRIGAEDIEGYFLCSSDLLTMTAQTLSYLINAGGPTAGGVLVPGRLIIVTASRKKPVGYVRAPAIILKSPESESSKSLVCIVLLSSNFIPEEGATNDISQKRPKEFELNYIGCSNHRYYIISNVILKEVLFVTGKKHKIDVNKLYKGDSQKLHFGNKKSVFSSSLKGIRKVDDFDFFDSFAKSQSSASSSQSQTVDHTIAFLLEAELCESSCTLEVMDLKNTNTKGLHQGDQVIQFRSTCTKIFDLVTHMRCFKSHRHPSLEKHYAIIERKESLRDAIQTLRHLLSNESLQLFPDFLQRKALLQTMNYIDSNDTVCVKGRVACEVNTCEELIVTEMVFEGVFNDSEPAEIAAALSTLIFQEKSNDEDLSVELPVRLLDICNKMKTIASNIGQLQNQHGLPIDPKDYCENSLKFGLVHVVYEWALGVPFSNICELTMVQEGSIVRCITRLDELCREVRNCARVVGNPTLYRKMEEASIAIKRDIVFASSLYVT